LHSNIEDQMFILNVVVDKLVHPEHGEKLPQEFLSADGARELVLACLIPAAMASALSLRKLSEDISLQNRDCFSISRSIVEIAINSCYLLASEQSVADKARRHALQRTYRELMREETFGELQISLKFQGVPSPSEIPGLEAALIEFTSKRGHELNWTNLSVKERLAVIKKRFGNTVHALLSAAYFGIYSNSSEILHGTFYGSMFFLALTQPRPVPGDLAEFKKRIGDQVFVAIFMVCVSFHALLLSFGQAFEAPVITEVAGNVMKSVKNIPFLHQNAEKSPQEAAAPDDEMPQA
jgi:hypothetical protein